MDPNFITSYLDHIEVMHKNFREAVEGLPLEAVDWTPGPEMNSMAVLLAHTVGSLRYWIGDVALGEPSDRVREKEFQTSGVASEELQNRLDALLAYVRASLPRLKLEDLEDERIIERENRPVTAGWALLHALEHANLHLGHVQMTVQLWRARSKTE
jgi:uncharacterized damage-inducible protein DinB